MPLIFFVIGFNSCVLRISIVNFFRAFQGLRRLISDSTCTSEGMEIFHINSLIDLLILTHFWHIVLLYFVFRTEQFHKRFLLKSRYHS